MRTLLAHPGLPIELITQELKTVDTKHRSSITNALHCILKDAYALEINTVGMSARERDSDPKVKTLIELITKRFRQMPEALRFKPTAEMPACEYPGRGTRSGCPSGRPASRGTSCGTLWSRWPPTPNGSRPRTIARPRPRSRPCAR